MSVWVTQSMQHLFVVSIDNTTNSTDMSPSSLNAYALGISSSFRSPSLWFAFITATSKQQWYCAMSSYWIAHIHRSDTQFPLFFIFTYQACSHLTRKQQLCNSHSRDPQRWPNRQKLWKEEWATSRKSSQPPGPSSTACRWMNWTILNIATRKTSASVAQSHKFIALIYTLLGTNSCITSEKEPICWYWNSCLSATQNLKHPKYCKGYCGRAGRGAECGAERGTSRGSKVD